MRVGERYSNFFCTPRFSSQSCQHSADGLVRRDDHRRQDRLLDFLNRTRRRKFRGVVDFYHLARRRRDAVLHARRGRDQVDVEFALEALLHDFHVQQAEKAAAETESERHRVLRLVEKRGVVELQFSERIAQCFVIARVHREKACENHGLDGFEARERRGRAIGFDDGVAHARVGHALDVGDDEADVARGELSQHDRLRRERAESFHLIYLVARAQTNLHVRGDPAFHHAHQHDRAAIRYRTRNRKSARAAALPPSPFGGGTRSTIASSTLSTPRPLFALIGSASSAGIASTFSICSLRYSGCAAGRSILLITGMMARLWRDARNALATVCASTPWLASTTSSAPSQAESARETS